MRSTISASLQRYYPADISVHVLLSSIPGSTQVVRQVVGIRARVLEFRKTPTRQFHERVVGVVRMLATQQRCACRATKCHRGEVLVERESLISE